MQRLHNLVLDTIRTLLTAPNCEDSAFSVDKLEARKSEIRIYVAGLPVRDQSFAGGTTGKDEGLMSLGSGALVRTMSAHVSQTLSLLAPVS